MVSTPMVRLFAVGSPRPWFGLWYANRSRFTHPGFYVWAFKRNIRILPTGRRTDG